MAGAAEQQARAAGWPEWRCPGHGEQLTLDAAQLVCPRGHAFPLVDGIPRFVGDSGYAAAFGAQWLAYRRTQLDSYTGTTISRDRLRRCLGAELWDSLPGTQVLECACGAGRFTEVLLGAGACVTAVDLSRAVEANLLNFSGEERHRVAQADILDLPFAPRRFDIVLCLGAVQHTPSPERTIEALYEQVRPGGWLVFDHYASRLGWVTRTAPLFRMVLRRLPPERGLRATEALVRLLLPLHRRSGRATKLLKRVSPLQTYYHALPELPEPLQREWALLDTHDFLTDRYKHYRGPARIGTLLERLGLEAISVQKGGNGVEARGRRPARRDA